MCGHDRIDIAFGNENQGRSSCPDGSVHGSTGRRRGDHGRTGVGDSQWLHRHARDNAAVGDLQHRLDTVHDADQRVGGARPGSGAANEVLPPRYGPWVYRPNTPSKVNCGSTEAVQVGYQTK